MSIAKQNAFKRIIVLEKEIEKAKAEIDVIKAKAIRLDWATNKIIDGSWSCKAELLKEHYPKLFNQLKDLLPVDVKGKSVDIVSRGKDYPRFSDGGYKQALKKTL